MTTPCQRAAENLLDLLVEARKGKRFQPADIFDSKKSAASVNGLDELIKLAEHSDQVLDDFLVVLAHKSGYGDAVLKWVVDDIAPNGIVRQVILNCGREILARANVIDIAAGQLPRRAA